MTKDRQIKIDIIEDLLNKINNKSLPFGELKKIFHDIEQRYFKKQEFVLDENSLLSQINDLYNILTKDSHIDLYFPSKIYHYTNLNSLNEILQTQTLQLSDIGVLNDPEDCQQKMDISISLFDKDIYQDTRNLKRKIEDKYASLGIKNLYDIKDQNKLSDHELNSRNNSFGIISFCGSKYNKLMWSHYAEKHKGVCIEFDTYDIICKVCDFKKNGIFSVFGIVNYIKYLNKINPNFLAYGNNAGDLKNFSIVSTYIRDIFFNKTMDWEYENEFRLVKYFPNQDKSKKDYIDIKGCIKKIYIGQKMNLCNMQSIKNITDIEMERIPKT